jgi:hypothetical protein
MSRFQDRFQRQTVLGDPITIGDVTITPQSQALAIRWSGGGWVWNRPLAVLVERDGETERIPIVDVTRVAQWTLLGISALFSVFVVGRTLIKFRERKGTHG